MNNKSINKEQTDTAPDNLIKKIISLFSREPADRQALITLLRNSETRDLLNHDALSMIEGALQISEMQARDIMVPRVQMVVVKHDLTPEDILATVVEARHSRFPVVGDNTDEVLGILLAKDLLRYFSMQTNFNIKDMMRTAIHIPESKRLNILLREFRSSRNHMAVVIDEYSVLSGLITMEDIIEKIVGNIEDEHDIEEEDYITLYVRDRYTVRALTPIEEFNKYFKTDLADEEYDTIGGLLLKSFGHVPQKGETIEFAGFKVKILRADKKRIRLIRLSRGPSPNNEENN